jgi:hypothetical protein
MENQSINGAGRHLPLDAGEVNNDVNITLALQVADVRLLNGHGTLEEVLAPEQGVRTFSESTNS